MPKPLALSNPHPAAKGVRQKESGKRVTKESDRSIRKSDLKVTEKAKKSDRAMNRWNHSDFWNRWRIGFQGAAKGGRQKE